MTWQNLGDVAVRGLAEQGTSWKSGRGNKTVGRFLEKWSGRTI